MYEGRWQIRRNLDRCAAGSRTTAGGPARVQRHVRGVEVTELVLFHVGRDPERFARIVPAVADRHDPRAPVAESVEATGTGNGAIARTTRSAEAVSA